MKHVTLTVVAACAALLAGGAFAATPKAPAEKAKATKPAASRSLSEISACMAKNLTKRGALRDLAATVTDREGKERKLRMRMFWKPVKGTGDSRVNLRLVEPAAVAGSSYLLLTKRGQEDVFFALPGATQGLRITGKNMSEPLFGTDFSYGEIKQVLGLLDTGTATKKADVTLEGRVTYVLETASKDEDTTYQRVLSYVDQESCTLVRSEFFEQADDEKARKVLTGDMSTLLQADYYWTLLGYTMRDMKQDSKTKLELTDLSFDERLPESLFTPEHFFDPYQ